MLHRKFLECVLLRSLEIYQILTTKLDRFQSRNSKKIHNIKTEENISFNIISSLTRKLKRTVTVPVTVGKCVRIVCFGNDEIHSKCIRLNAWDLRVPDAFSHMEQFVGHSKSLTLFSLLKSVIR